ncbi:MAG: hypothetical protein DRI44_05705 [Chlamydiae bacterium]|nr:MAG: hypothetical protein DRI44_05705 [Chlamydiota bacterium]
MNFTSSLDSVVTDYIKSKIEPVKKENEKLQLKCELLQKEKNDLLKRNAELRGMITSLREENKMLLLQNNEKIEQINKFNRKLQRLRTLKILNEKNLSGMIDNLRYENEKTLSELRVMVERNKELYHDNEELQNALNDKLASVPLDNLMPVIRQISFIDFIKIKLGRL